MKAIDTFNAAISRAQHLLKLYELLQDTRSYSVRSDWAARFKDLMRWPSTEHIVRVDGLHRQSILVLRASVGIDRKHFSHEYLCELLRAVVVASVSALDRYLHDLVVDHSWKLLSRTEEQIPTELRKVQVPVLATKRALERLRADSKSRPGHLVKQAIQEQLHRSHTFQKPDSVELAARMLGVTGFWTEVAKRMPGTPAAGDVKEKLRRIAERRNQIVHEADVIRKTRAKKITLRDISEAEARGALEWIEKFALAVDKVVAAAV